MWGCTYVVSACEVLKRISTHLDSAGMHQSWAAVTPNTFALDANALTMSGTQKSFANVRVYLLEDVNVGGQAIFVQEPAAAEHQGARVGSDRGVDRGPAAH